MLPLLTFATGIVAGIAGVRLLKAAATRSSIDAVGAKAQNSLHKAQTTVRGATISGLSIIEQTTARMRSKLTAEPPAEAAEPQAAPETEAPPKSEPASESVVATLPAGVTP